MHPMAVGRSAWLGATLLGLSLVAAARAQDTRPAASPGTDAPQRAMTEAPAPTSVVARRGEPLDLLLTRAEMQAFIRHYELATGEVLTAPIDDEEVVVSAPGELAPMRDVSQDAWGGIAAPFWAIMNPGNAWRIFLPIPPRSDRR